MFAPTMAAVARAEAAEVARPGRAARMNRVLKSEVPVARTRQVLSGTWVEAPATAARRSVPLQFRYSSARVREVTLPATQLPLARDWARVMTFASVISV